VRPAPDLGEAGPATAQRRRRWKYRADGDAAAKLAVEPDWLRGDNRTEEANLLDEASVARLAAQAAERHRGLDILVNNVGSYRRVAFPELTEPEWRATLDTNLTLPYLVTRHFLAQLTAGSSVINIGVAMAPRGMPLHSHYRSSSW
jgi:NAD(P)-dependent dehydrogenase (short-subunit alcohol dehydrogenase family)